MYVRIAEAAAVLLHVYAQNAAVKRLARLGGVRSYGCHLHHVRIARHGSGCERFQIARCDAGVYLQISLLALQVVHMYGYAVLILPVRLHRVVNKLYHFSRFRIRYPAEFLIGPFGAGSVAMDGYIRYVRKFLLRVGIPVILSHRRCLGCDGDCIRRCVVASILVVHSLRIDCYALPEGGNTHRNGDKGCRKRCKIVHIIIFGYFNAVANINRYSGKMKL